MTVSYLYPTPEVAVVDRYGATVGQNRGVSEKWIDECCPGYVVMFRSGRKVLSRRHARGAAFLGAPDADCLLVLLFYREEYRARCAVTMQLQ